MTDRAVHQGLALKVPAYEYADPARPRRPARADAGEPPLLVALDSVTDPRNLGAVVRSAGGVRRARRRRTRASGRRDDRQRVEDVGRSSGAGAGRAGHQPDPAAQGVPGATA